MELSEILKNQGLSDEQINNILSAMEENKIYVTSIKNADEECSKLETEKNNLKGQLDTANTTIKEREKTIENLKKDKINSIKESAIDAKFVNVPDKYKELLKPRIDREKITINEDGTISGLDEQYNPLIETYSELIEDKEPINTGSPGDYARKNNKIENNSQSSFMEAIKNNQLRK